MQDVAVYFKGVDTSRVRDLKDDDELNEADRQLKKVLDFQRQLRQSKDLFYGEFEDTEELTRKIWTQLAQWKRNHEDRLEPSGVTGVHDIEDLPNRGHS